MEKLGVVIFSYDYYTDEGLAALRWASVFPQSKVHIVLVEVYQQMNGTEKEKFSRQELVGAVQREGKNKEKNKEVSNFKVWVNEFEGYLEKIVPEKDNVVLYKGPNIQKILEDAIEDFKLHTLVLGMAAVGSTPSRNIDLIMQLNSKCSVVLAKIDPKPPTSEISATPAATTDPAPLGSDIP